MKITNVQIGDILYDPIKNFICEVTAFGEDRWGQGAIEYKIGARTTVHSSAWIVFRHFIRLERCK